LGAIFDGARTLIRLIQKALTLVEYSPEKAGVGGSIPSLATMFSTTSEHLKPQFCPTLSQKNAGLRGVCLNYRADFGLELGPLTEQRILD